MNREIQREWANLRNLEQRVDLALQMRDVTPWISVEWILDNILKIERPKKNRKIIDDFETQNYEEWNEE